LDRTGQTLLGKYQLTRLLGKGGMGEVWEGEHLVTGRRVAVKVLSDNYLTNRKVVARFGREARAASAVQHDGIVEILDQDKTDDGVPFLVMEFLEGESVGARLRARGKFSQAEALAVMLPLLDALDAAHQAGVIHRDLKPDNVFILPGERGAERIKILDFGISRKADEIEYHLTQEGSVLGTPHYMSPEQARGESDIDARADVYAAAVLFYECVVGDVPFDAGNYNALLQIILGTKPVPPRARGADITRPVEQVLLAALEKDKLRRPPSARAFHDLLLAAAAQAEDMRLDTERWTFVKAAPPTPPPRASLSPSGPLRVPAPPRAVPTPSLSPQRAAPIHSAAPPRAAQLGSAARAASEPLRVPEPPLSGVRRAPTASAAGPKAPAEFRFVSSEPARAAAAAPAPSTPARTVESVQLALRPLEELEASPPRQATVQARRVHASMAPAGRRELQGDRAARRGEAAGASSRLWRTVGNWLALLLAVAVLWYLANLVFHRPDPRKHRPQGGPQETSQTQEE
jgi:serine/threonine protein kinase